MRVSTRRWGRALLVATSAVTDAAAAGERDEKPARRAKRGRLLRTVASNYRCKFVLAV